MAQNLNFNVRNGLSVGVGGTILNSVGNNFGIGKTNPTTALDVVGTVTATTFSGNLANTLTFNNSGSGAVSGTGFSNSSSQTISFNTIGAASSTGTNATGTWGISITGTAGSATTATTATNQSGGTVNASTGSFSGQITASSGSSTAPGYSFTGDTGTGFYRIAANTLGFSTGSSERLRIDSSGNIGIGTTVAPSQKLHVVGNARITGSLYDSNNATGSSGQLLTSTGTGTSWSNEVNSLSIGTGGTIFISSGSSIGIGTTNPLSPLAVNGYITENPGDGTYWNVVTQKDIGVAGNQIPLNQYLGTMAFQDNIFINVGSIALGTNYTGTAGFTSPSQDTITAFTASTERLRITSTGRFGLGITNPEAGIHFTGGVYFPGAGTTSTALTIGVGQIVGGFGAHTTSGTIDWNDISNARSGSGFSLLLGTATNGPGATYGGYYHPFSFEYTQNKAGTSNLTQLGIPYNVEDDGIIYRTRIGGTWSNWYRTVVHPTNVTGLRVDDNGITIVNSNTALSSTANQYLQVNGGAYVSGNVGIGTTNPSYNLDVSGSIRSESQILVTGAGSTVTGAGQIYLNGATSNRIDFNVNGASAPTFNTRSPGTKIVLYPNVGASGVDYAIGMEAANMWFSTTTTSAGFKWYGGTTLAATLTGAGALTLTGALSTTTGTFSGDVAANGGDITTTSATASVFDATATTVNAFGGATTLNLGHDGTSASTTNIATGALASGTKTLNIGTGATTGTTNINLGPADVTGTTTVGGYLTVRGRIQTATSKTAASWTTTGIAFDSGSATYTNSTGTGTIATQVANSFNTPTFASGNTITVTDAATIFVNNSPAAGTNTTITDPWAIFVNNGYCRFDGAITVGGVNPARGPILTGTITNGGTGYTAGTYTNVSLSGGRGTYAYADITVGAGGTVTAVTISREGRYYQAGDVLSGTFSVGTGFSYTVSTVRSVDLQIYNTAPRIRLGSSNISVTTGTELGSILFGSSDSTSGDKVRLIAAAEGTSGGGQLQVWTSANGGEANIAMVVDGNNNLRIYNSSGTFYNQFASSATANRTITLPDDTTTMVGTGITQTLTNKTLTSPAVNGATYGNGSTTTDADVTVDSSTTTFYAYVQSASTTTRTINISNLTAGRFIQIYLRNTNAGTKTINITASTTTSGFAAVNLSKGDAGGTSQTSVTLAATSGTALITIFNAGGVFCGSIA